MTDTNEAKAVPARGPAGALDDRRRGLHGAADGGAALLLLAATALLYGSVTTLWWSADDFFQLRFASAWRPAQYALDPAVWRQLPTRMVTPLLFVSYDADLAAFGLQPRAFYVHQLVALGLAVVAVFATLRLWVERRWALAGALLVLLGPPVASLPALLMVRHYVECLLLSALSVAVWVPAVRAHRPARGLALAVASAALWLLACLAKEIAVPLIVLLASLPEGTLRTRLLRLLPHALALAAYVSYRFWLLGTLDGGYGWAAERGDWTGLLLALPSSLGSELLGDGPVAAVVLVLALAGCGHLVWQRPAAGALLGGALLLAAIPVLPVSLEMTPRYAVGAWVVVAIGAVLGARKARGGWALTLVGLAAALAANRLEWPELRALRERQDAEVIGLLSSRPGDLVRRPAATAASLHELRHFARELLGREVAGGWFADDLYLCARGGTIQRLLEYDAAAGRLIDSTARLPALRQTYCDALRPAAPLTVTFQAADGILRWRLGPHRGGTWHFVFDEGTDAHAVPARGAFRTPRQRLELRVRYQDPSGWVTYSAPLRMDFQLRPAWSWRRD